MKAKFSAGWTGLFQGGDEVLLDFLTNSGQT
jgi:hypothetical protein